MVTFNATAAMIALKAAVVYRVLFFMFQPLFCGSSIAVPDTRPPKPRRIAVVSSAKIAAICARMCFKRQPLHPSDIN
jgi:hypothetical protein